MIAVVNPYYISKFFKDNDVNGEDKDAANIQFEGVEFGAFYLIINLIVGGILVNRKIPRRLIMTVGHAMGFLMALILTALALLVMLESSRKIFFYYWAFVCIANGVVVEVYVE